MDKDYIIPTTKEPVFTAYCDDFGCIEGSFYKDWSINNICGNTYATNLTDAIVELHDFIKWYAKNESSFRKKSTFYIELIDGSVDKNGDVIKKKVYSINGATAKKVRLV